MALRNNQQKILNALENVPPQQAGALLYQATSAAADARIEAMSLDLQTDLKNVGRQTSFEILFALALFLERNGVTG